MKKVVEVMWLTRHRVIVNCQETPEAEAAVEEVVIKGLRKMNEHDPNGPQYVEDSFRIIDITTSH